MRIFSFIILVLSFLVQTILFCERKFSYNNEMINLSNLPEVSTITITSFIENHYEGIDFNITDPYKIFQNSFFTRKRPEKVVKAFLEIINSKTPEEQKKFIEENQGRIWELMESLSHKLERRTRVNPEEITKFFGEMVDVLAKNEFFVNPELFPNFRDVVIERLEKYIREVNEKIERLPRERRMPPLSLNNLNYENAINKISEFAQDIKKDLNRARNKASQISINFSTNTTIQNTIARIFLSNSQYKDAKEYADRTLKIDENNYDAYTIRAEARYSLKDIKGAIEDVKRAQEIDPSNETTKLLLSYIAKSPSFAKSKFDEMKDSFGNVNGDYNKIDEEKDKGRRIEFSEKNALEISRSNLESFDEAKSNYYLKQAIVKTQIGDLETALKYINMAIEKNPENLNAYLERANVNNLMGRYDEAIKDATYVLRFDSVNIYALNMRAWALYKKGDIENAYNDTTKAIDLKPDYADAMFLRALVYEKQNRFEEMLRDLEKASKLNPNYADKFHDAVANYAARAPNFLKYYDKNKEIFNVKKDITRPFDWKRFAGLLLLTVIGGIFIGISLLHVFSPRITTHTHTNSSQVSGDVITPNVFYEGVATGKYKIVKKIGQGGMGTVYLAIDQTLGREVAIKKMNEDLKMNEREKQRFIDEARTVAMLHHPNIIEIYTIFEEKGDIYLVFEYIDGVSLDKKLDMEVRMPFYEVKEIVNEISKALSYAHMKNVVHRDLKLSNVMISKEGFVKVMDFGLAKIVREAKARYSSSEIVGSPAYMAPEQDLGIFVKESDLYSLGVCIYEMLTGELPFTGPDYHYQKEKKLYTPLTSVVAGLDPKIDFVVNKLLEPRPEDRYHSVEEFLKDFNSIT